MEIRGHNAYLSIREQITSELQSPLLIGQLDILKCLREAKQIYEEANEALNADPNEGLPFDRAVALRNVSVYGARKDIYTSIAGDLVLHGVIDMAAYDAAS